MDAVSQADIVGAGRGLADAARQDHGVGPETA